MLCKKCGPGSFVDTNESDRGHPDARELVLLRLADLSLSGGERLDGSSGLDATAMAGLRHDGLLQASHDNPFMIGPRILSRRSAPLRGRSPTLWRREIQRQESSSAEAPRWALSAAKLACQTLLALPNTHATPLRGRFAGLQKSFDRLVETGYGARWGDVPSEALVTLADSKYCPQGCLARAACR